MTTTPIPREHGAYVVLLACWLLGLLTATRVDIVPAVLSLVASLAAFAATEPSRLWIVERRSGRRDGKNSLRWLIGLGIAGGAAGIPLLAIRPDVLWLLPPAAAVLGLYLWLLARRASMSDLSFAGFAGLSLTGPLALMAADPAWQAGQVVALWVFSAVFFGASAWCVRIRLVGVAGVRNATIAHLGLAVAALALVQVGALPPIALAAIVPAIVRFVWVTADVDRYRKQPLKRIGVMETVIALGLVVAAFWF